MSCFLSSQVGSSDRGRH